MKTSVTAKQYFFTLNFTYYMQIFTVLAFSLVVGFLVIRNSQTPIADNNSWVFIVSVMLISSLVMSWFVFRLMLKGINSSSLRLQEKMPKYARAVLVRSVLIEVPGLGAALAAYLTNNPNFLAVALMVAVIFLILRPTKNTIVQDLSLSPKEKIQLDDEKAIISEVN